SLGLPATGCDRASPAGRAMIPSAELLTEEPALAALEPELLTMMNFNAGPADGKLSRQTRNAIASFQRQQKLRVTSRPSPALLDALRKAAGADTPDWTPGHF
ncbi:peptidoglycan-binding domain-containing protein, partial [Inquilinus limosus]